MCILPLKLSFVSGHYLYFHNTYLYQQKFVLKSYLIAKPYKSCFHKGTITIKNICDHRPTLTDESPSPLNSHFLSKPHFNIIFRDILPDCSSPNQAPSKYS